MKYILINTNTLSIADVVGLDAGVPLVRTVGDPLSFKAPVGYAYAEEVKQEKPALSDPILNVLERRPDEIHLIGEDYKVHTNIYHEVPFVPPYTHEAPKYMVVSLLEEEGYPNIQTQVQGVIDDLPEPHKHRANNGWHMQSTLRRDNSLLALIQSELSIPDSVMNDVFYRASQFN